MKKIFGATIGFFLIAMFVNTVSVGAVGIDAWFDSGQEKSIGLIQEGVAIPDSLKSAASCSQVSIRAMQYNYWHVPGSVGEPQDVCARAVGYGLFGYTVYPTLSLGDTGVLYRFQTEANPVIGGEFYPLPGSSSVVYVSARIGFYDNFINRIEPVYSGGLLNKKLVRYKITGTGEEKFAHFEDDGVVLSNSSLGVGVSQGLGFSGNGKWLATNPGYYQAITNISTGTTRRFGSKNIELGRYASRAKVILNHSGSLALVASTGPSIGYIYDLTKCESVGVGKPEECPVYDIMKSFPQLFSSNNVIEYARFINDTGIEIYVRNMGASVLRRDKYLLSVGGSQQFGMDYLALGDSYASGEGTFDYIKKTDQLPSNMCHLGASSYPYLIGLNLAIPSHGSVSCSGAKMKDVAESSSSSARYEDDNPQSSGKDDEKHDPEIYENLLPGYRRQVEYLRYHRPKIVTLSVGGNDIGFGDKLQVCVMPGTCFNSSEHRAKIFKEVSGQFNKLTNLYSEIRDILPDSRIYVIGYPQIANKDGSCGLNVRLNKDELLLAEDLIGDLNKVIEMAAKRSGVVYVDVSEALKGVRLCDSSPSGLAMHGVTAGKDQEVFGRRVIGKESYHPNRKGHQLYEKTIVEATEGLKKPMAGPDSSVVGLGRAQSALLKDIDSSSIDFEGLPQPKIQAGITFQSERIMPGNSLSTSITVDGASLAKGQVFRVEVHSSPQVIGEAIAEGIDTLSVQASLPQDLPPGPHEVHIIGNDIAGRPVDLYQYITVIHSEDDVDGDGTPNAQDQCSFIEPAGVDVDADGVDDACDSEIGEPPAPLPVPQKPTLLQKITKLVTVVVGIFKKIFKLF